MKIALVAFALASQTASAAPPLDKRNFLDLGTSRPRVAAYVGYPGPGLSGICGVAIRVNHHRADETALSRLASRLRVTDFGRALTPVVGGERIAYRLTSLGKYLANVAVETVNGEPLNRAIAAALGRTPVNEQAPTAILVATGCR